MRAIAGGRARAPSEIITKIELKESHDAGVASGAAAAGADGSYQSNRGHTTVWRQRHIDAPSRRTLAVRRAVLVAIWGT
jgi:hypothetical protein